MSTHVNGLSLLALLLLAQGAAASNNPKASKPEGFGAGTTGGTGGEVVTVTTKEELVKQLCKTRGADGACSDKTPRIIQFSKTFDFTGSQGTAKGSGCDPVDQCKSPFKTESLVLLSSTDQHCEGKQNRRQITYDAAGKDPILVGSNKTLIGQGAAATIKGKGLRLYNVSNVVIRNLAITDINPGIVFTGDAIAIDKSDRIWIDHNRFHNIARQMIATGYGATTNMTVSWNDFDGNNLYSPFCNGQHYWNVLLDANPQTITFSNNLFQQVSGRAPHIESPSSTVHLVNNYFRNDSLSQNGGGGHALFATGAGVNVLVEGNYYANIKLPIGSSTGNVFATLGDPNTAANTQCTSALGRHCTGNIANPTPSTNNFTQASSAVSALKSVAKSLIVVPYPASQVPANLNGKVGPGKL